MSILPHSPIEVQITDPKRILIFSKAKAGKTSILALLPNCLILDFEEGSDFVKALKVKILGINVPKETEIEKSARVAENKFYLTEIGTAIREEGFPYTYIAVDTVTGLEDMCIGYAEEIYSKTPMGKYWFVRNPQNTDDPRSGKEKYSNILGMPEGAGYYWLRQAMDKVINYITPLAPKIILSGHVKDVFLDKAGVEFTSSDVDLTGKIKRSICTKADAIGYLVRKGKKNILSFKTTDTVACEARPEHLRGQEIVIAEIDENGDLVSHWDRVFLEDKNLK